MFLRVVELISPMWWKKFPLALQLAIPKAIKASSPAEIVFFIGVIASAGYGSSLLVSHEAKRATLTKK